MNPTYTVHTPFANLQLGDEIQFKYLASENCLKLVVLNRTITKRFYGNTKGLWGKGNPYTGGPKFCIIEEEIPPFTLMTFSINPTPPPHPTKEFSYQISVEEFINSQIETIIDSFSPFLTEN